MKTLVYDKQRNHGIKKIFTALLTVISYGGLYKLIESMWDLGALTVPWHIAVLFALATVLFLINSLSALRRYLR